MSNEKFKVKFGLAVGDTVATVDGTTGDIITAGTLDVQGGSITDSTGALTISTGAADGAITLDPNGTGDVVLTFANGGNLTNSRNYVYGAIRNATTESNGDEWSFSSGAGSAYRGVTLDNSIDTTKRVGVILRSYGVSGGAPRSGIISEIARGTAASPSNINSSDRLLELFGSGYVGAGGTSAVSGWASDNVVNVPAALRFVANETWNDGLNKVGTRFQVIQQPSSTAFTTTSTLLTFNHAPEDTTIRSDSFTLSNKAGSDMLTVNSSGDVVLTGDLQINGNNILSSGATNALTLQPITGFNSNTYLDGNLVKGIIRDATTEAAGDVWSFSSGTSSNTRGISVDNSVVPSKRPGYITRAYSSGSGVAARAMFVTEVARGNPSGGLSAVQNTDRFCEITAQGYNGTAWTSDVVVNNPFTIRGQATEAWSESPRRAGSKFLVIAQPSGVDYTTSSTSTIIDHNPLTATYIADAWTFKTRTTASGGTNTTQLTLDSSGNAVLTGDLTVTGNEIKSSSANTVLEFNDVDARVAGELTITGNKIRSSNGAFPGGDIAVQLTGNDVEVVGDLTVTGNEIKSSTANTVLQFDDVNARVVGELTVAGNKIRSGSGSFPGGDIALEFAGNDVTSPGNIQGATLLTVGPFDTSQTITANAFLLDTNTAAGATLGVNVKYKPSSGSSTFSIPQSGWRIGGYKFNGDDSTTGTASVLAGQLSVVATENWVNGTANGTAIQLLANKNGQPWLTGHGPVASFNPNSSYIKSDLFSFLDSSNVNLIGNNINYNRVYGQWQYDNTITPVASNTAYAFPIASGVVDFANIATVGSTSRIIPGAAGMYKLQFSVQVSNDDNAAEHTAYFWWRKNGTDVPGSMGQVGVVKATGANPGLTIAGWDNMISSANTTDYWELMYAVSNSTHLSFPAFGTTAFGPSTASLFITLVPVGA